MNMLNLRFAVAGFFFIFTNLVTAAQPVNTGTGSTGGGGAFVHASGDALFLDLWENDIDNFPEEPFGDRGLRIRYSQDPVDDQLNFALQKLDGLDQGFFMPVRKWLRHVRNAANQWKIPAHISIPAPHDARNDFSPRGYQLTGMFLYDDSIEVLSIDEGIFTNLENNTHRAAAWLHEAIYKVMRIRGSALETSKLPRRLTACLFSDDTSTTKCLQKSPYTDSDFNFRCTNASASMDVGFDPELNSWEWPLRITRLLDRNVELWSQSHDGFHNMTHKLSNFANSHDLLIGDIEYEHSVLHGLGFFTNFFDEKGNSVSLAEELECQEMIDSLE